MHDTLTQPSSGTVLFVEQDRRPFLVRRIIVGTCTQDEWDNPITRMAAIGGLWRVAPNVRSEGETLLGPAPVTLYRHPMTGEVLWADIQNGWITATGTRLVAPPQTAGLWREQTTYAHWAEGPRPYVGNHAPLAPPDPLLDRSLQEVRHRNAWLQARIDAAIEASRDPIAVDAGDDELIDFRVRAICSRPDPRVLISKQTGDAATILVDGERIGMDEIDPAFTVEEA